MEFSSRPDVGCPQPWLISLINWYAVRQPYPCVFTVTWRRNDKAQLVRILILVTPSLGSTELDARITLSIHTEFFEASVANNYWSRPRNYREFQGPYIPF